MITASTGGLLINLCAYEPEMILKAVDQSTLYCFQRVLTKSLTHRFTDPLSLTDTTSILQGRFNPLSINKKVAVVQPAECKGRLGFKVKADVPFWSTSVQKPRRQWAIRSVADVSWCVHWCIQTAQLFVFSPDWRGEHHFWTNVALPLGVDARRLKRIRGRWCVLVHDPAGNVWEHFSSRVACRTQP